VEKTEQRVMDCMMAGKKDLFEESVAASFDVAALKVEE